MVYCKDCKNYFDCGFCSLYNEKRSKDEFCSRGEKKTHTQIREDMKPSQCYDFDLHKELIVENMDEAR